MAEITTRKHNLEDNALWRALFLTAGPRSANCQQRRNKLVGRTIKNTPNLEIFFVFYWTIIIDSFLLFNATQKGEK